ASETLTGRLDDNLQKLGEKYSGFADILSAVKGAVMEKANTDIDLPAGSELTLRLAAPLPPPVVPPEPPRAITPRNAVAALVLRQPFQTIAQRPPKPSDVTNLLL